MDSEQPPQSPFAPGFEGVSSAEAPTPPAPDPYQGGEPRLGIIHLLVWTACVAFLLGINQSFPSSFSPGDRANRISLAFGIQSLGAGAGLAGLLLWGWRRYRGRAFPRYPGEYFLVAIGLTVALSVPFTIWFCFLAASVGTRGGLSSAMRMVTGWIWAQTILFGIVYLAAAIRMKATRWRLVFLLCLGIAIARRSDILLRLFPIFPTWLALSFAGDVFLGVALWLDWRQKLRYPWPHWLGIAIIFWDTVAQLTWLLLR